MWLSLSLTSPSHSEIRNSALSPFLPRFSHCRQKIGLPLTLPSLSQISPSLSTTQSMLFLQPLSDTIVVASNFKGWIFTLISIVFHISALRFYVHSTLDKLTNVIRSCMQSYPCLFSLSGFSIGFYCFALHMFDSWLLRFYVWR